MFGRARPARRVSAGDAERGPQGQQGWTRSEGQPNAWQGLLGSAQRTSLKGGRGETSAGNRVPGTAQACGHGGAQVRAGTTLLPQPTTHRVRLLSCCRAGWGDRGKGKSIGGGRRGQEDAEAGAELSPKALGEPLPWRRGTCSPWHPAPGGVAGQLRFGGNRRRKGPQEHPSDPLPHGSGLLRSKSQGRRGEAGRPAGLALGSPALPRARPWQRRISPRLLASGRQQTAARTLWLLLQAQLPAPPCQSGSTGAEVMRRGGGLPAVPVPWPLALWRDPPSQPQPLSQSQKPDDPGTTGHGLGQALVRLL